MTSSSKMVLIQLQAFSLLDPALQFGHVRLLAHDLLPQAGVSCWVGLPHAGELRLQVFVMDLYRVQFLAMP